MFSLPILVLMALAAGAGIAVQAGVNAQLGRSLGNPVLAAFVSFALGTAVLLAVLLAFRAPFPSLQTVQTVPVWAWIGGALGAYFVTASIIVAPRLGAASLVAILVAAQLVAALVLDHFGLLGFPHQPVTWQRIAGAVLLAGGVVLIRFA